MNYFEYVEPRTVKEACAFLEQHEEARVLAGGASLVVLQKNGFIRPSHLVNLKTIPGLDTIEEGERGLRIGALNRHCDILSSPVVKRWCPVLSVAASKIATPPIRNMGTIGGNLCHGDPAADFPPSLIALGAMVKLVSGDGERTVALDSFFVDYYETVLARGEIMTELEIPSPGARWAGSYVTLDQVTNSVAIVSAAAVLGLDQDGTCTYAGVGLGGIAPTPLALHKAREILVGRKITEKEVEHVAKEARSGSSPAGSAYASAEYRKEMAYVLTQRALRDALKQVGT